MMISVALKEWKVVCEMLVGGEMGVMLRKGGIHERGGPGVFELEHSRFGLYPTWEHEELERLKPPYRSRITPAVNPLQIPIEGYAEVARIWEVKSRGVLEGLDDLHCWSGEYLDMRFGYRADRPVYLVALRAWRLVEPKVIGYRGEFAGCKSWVALREDESVDESEGKAVMSEEEFGRIVERIESEMG